MTRITSDSDITMLHQMAQDLISDSVDLIFGTNESKPKPELKLDILL